MLRRLRASARAVRRSLNAELLTILESATSRPPGARKSAHVGETVMSYPTGPEAPRSPLPAELVDTAELVAVCRRYHIERLAVFGSFARGEATPESDVDVVVDFAPGMTPGLGIERVAAALARVFGRRVDLVTRRGLSPRFRERILGDSVLLHGT